VAEQLCLLEHKLYIKIRQQECLQWADTQTGHLVENLAAFCATHDKLVAWVKMSILDSEVIGRRADTIAFWIKAAEKSKNLNNFASMSAMINGLSSTTVSRLNLTWAHVGRRSALDSLLKYNEPTGSFSEYRGLLHSVEGPCVPFIGMFLTDIVHIGDQFPDTISPTSACASDPFISFQKRHRWHDVVVAMLRYQNRPFHIAENVSTRDFINNHLTLASTKEQSWFWLRSQELQKIEMTHFDIRQGLEAAGF
jgi:son of sevenless-like protein